jgi:hypothetical protein
MKVFEIKKERKYMYLRLLLLFENGLNVFRFRIARVAAVAGTRAGLVARLGLVARVDSFHLACFEIIADIVGDSAETD